ncbi:MAG: tRNA preQ1(34) S-adenosylmethionine ribosyltransferase-isomerase QueA [Myxococcota bacterium]
MDSLDDWDFDLPDHAIARVPTAIRSASRLMVVPKVAGELSDRSFSDLPTLLRPGDLLVANDSRVMAARLRATRATGGRIELMVLGPGPGEVDALARPARKLHAGDVLTLDGGGMAVVTRAAVDGVIRVVFDRDPAEVMAEQGEPPLPPYLGRPAEPDDHRRYQTVYAGPLGSSAAPTAGLHFDPSVLDALRAREIGFCTVTLHVGLGTFRPLRDEDLARGALHAESYAVPAETAARIAATRAGGGRVIAVGTTSARTLESATPAGARFPLPGGGVTRLFVRPPYALRAIDGLITNFHLPRSSLLMLVAALCGRKRLLAAYDRAVRTGYRFYSYGDAMLVVDGIAPEGG